MEEERDRDRSSSLKQALRTSICFSCCFPSGRRETVEAEDERPRLIRNSSAWLRSRAQELPELKDKCRNLISRMGRSRRQSSDFRYDPLSYALNFDEGLGESRADDEFPFRNFSSRLPASPPPAAGVAISHEIACN